MDKKVTGIIAYIGIIGWLIAYLAGDREGAKFHLNQALVLALASVLCSILSAIPLIGFVAGLASLGVLVFAILGLVSAVKDEEKPLPIIGGIQLLK